MLSLKDIENVLKKFKVKEIILSGGEPTVHPNFIGIAQNLIRICAVSLYTNGLTRLPDDLLLKFHRIYVSVYGWERFHNNVVRCNTFQETLWFLINAGIQTQCYNHFNSVVVNSPVFGKETEEVIAVAKTGDFFIHLFRLLPHGRARNIKVLDREKQLNIAQKIKEGYPKTVISQSLLHERCNYENKLTLLPNNTLIHCVAGKLQVNPNQAYICDKVDGNK